jgi:hypothetical protein
LDNQLCIYQRKNRKIIPEFKKSTGTRSKLVKLEDFVDTFSIEVNHDVVFFDETKDTSWRQVMEEEMEAIKN